MVKTNRTASQQNTFQMQTPIGPPVEIRSLVPGKRYYGFSNSRFGPTSSSRFRATFTEYFVNGAGYDMLRFHDTTETTTNGVVYHVGSPTETPHGLFFRIWDPPTTCGQSFTYYNESRFDDAQKKELKARVILRERRQYERGLTGTRPDGKWFPRDLVREISLRYLTDDTVNCADRWRLVHRNRGDLDIPVPVR